MPYNNKLNESLYIYSQHIIALIISLGQNMSVQNVILPRGLMFFTLFSVLFLSFFQGFLPARGRKTDYIINMALQDCIFVWLFSRVNQASKGKMPNGKFNTLSTTNISIHYFTGNASFGGVKANISFVDRTSPSFFTPCSCCQKTFFWWAISESSTRASIITSVNTPSWDA